MSEIGPLLNYVLGLPFFGGIVLAAMFDNVAKKAKQIIDGLEL